MKKYIVIVFLLFAVVMVSPQTASAAHTDEHLVEELQAQIQVLLVQIQTLQAQIEDLEAQLEQQTDNDDDGRKERRGEKGPKPGRSR